MDGWTVKARAHVYVGGRVQGVFFRAETANFAHRLGLAGWVRNLPDGRVEALFEGDRDKVEEAVAFSQRGPPGAHVQDFDVKWEEWRGEFKEFRVVH
ncbi:MAG: acylphosphatase [Candidatus Bathyarchaeia archaeon]|jgi:acylphosphatase